MTLNPGVLIRQRLQRWAKARNKSGNPQHLTPRNVYILPSAFGWAYGIVLLSIITGAVNYQLNPAFIFTFVLMIIALLSMWETHRNLKGLSILLLAIEDTQQNHSVKVHLMLSCDKPIRFGLNFCLEGGEPVRVEQLSQGTQMTLPLATAQRGMFKLPALKIHSYFPFGLFCTWSYAIF